MVHWLSLIIIDRIYQKNMYGRRNAEGEIQQSKKTSQKNSLIQSINQSHSLMSVFPCLHELDGLTKNIPS